MAFAIGDGHECGKQTIMIEADVKFDRSFGGAELGPGKNTETQVDGGCVERVELVLEAEAMARGAPLTLPKELSGQLLVERVGLSFVDSGQRRTGYDSATQMIQLGGLGREVSDDIAKTGPTGELGERHGDKLRPAGHLTQSPTRMVLIGQGLEFMSRDQFEYLRENGTMMCQGLISFCLINVLSRFHCIKTTRFSGLSS